MYCTDVGCLEGAGDLLSWRARVGSVGADANGLVIFPEGGSIGNVVTKT